MSLCAAGMIAQRRWLPASGSPLGSRLCCCLSVRACCCSTRSVWRSTPSAGRHPNRNSESIPASTVLLYYITDRRQFPGNGEEQRQRLLAKIAECAAAGVDYIQLREKDLTTRELHRLAEEAIASIPADSRTRLLINSRVDVALACGAHGVH